MKSIVHVPNEVLNTPAKPVTYFDKKLKRLITDLTATLIAAKNPKGVGLAAPQIGEPYRVFVTKPQSKSPVRVFINPEISKQSETVSQDTPKNNNKLEGCLSIPYIWGKVKRANALTLSFLDEKGVKHYEEFTGFEATIIQHETDHINGVLYTQRVLEQQGKLFQAEKDKDGKEVLEEIKL